jgi:hypothetical protein
LNSDCVGLLPIVKALQGFNDWVIDKPNLFDIIMESIEEIE